jgi:hypothetical protein
VVATVINPVTLGEETNTMAAIFYPSYSKPSSRSHTQTNSVASRASLALRQVTPPSAAQRTSSSGTLSTVCLLIDDDSTSTPGCSFQACLANMVVS